MHFSMFRKHFPFEDYDQWLFGPQGLWHNDSTVARPDVLIVQTGLHSCAHAIPSTSSEIDQNMLLKHEKQIGRLIKMIGRATNRPRIDGPDGSSKPPTMVILSLAPRAHTGDTRSDQCTWSFNRKLAMQAHGAGIPVLEREEIEHRLLFKSENAPPHLKNYKGDIHHGTHSSSHDGHSAHSPHSTGGTHSADLSATAGVSDHNSDGHVVGHLINELHAPGPQIVATALLSMISCLMRNGTDPLQFPPFNYVHVQL